MKLQSAAVSCASQQQVPNIKSFFTDWKDETHKDLFLHVYNGTTSKQERTQLLEMAILWDHFDAAERALYTHQMNHWMLINLISLNILSVLLLPLSWSRSCLTKVSILMQENHWMPFFAWRTTSQGRYHLLRHW